MNAPTMSRAILEENEARNRHKIEKVMMYSGRTGMTVLDIMTRTGLSRPTVKRHLEKLAAMDRVHIEKYGLNDVYFWNGVGKFSDCVKLSDSHKLYIDIMINPWAQPYVRIRETKKIGNEWLDMGAIIVDRNKVDELVEKLKKMKENIGKY